jgi:hypothetical protein
VTGPRQRIGEEAAAMMEVVDRIERLAVATGPAALALHRELFAEELNDRDAAPLLAARALGLLTVVARLVGPSTWHAFREHVGERGLRAMDDVPPL